MKNKHDAIVVIGYRFEDRWKLPHHLLEGLQIAATLYKQSVAPYIAVCGKWSLSFDRQHVVPPTTEAEKMKKTLMTFGIPKSSIVKEENSKDTIGNAYFVKKEVIEPLKLHRLLIICARYHFIRVQYVFKKIFGRSYDLDYKVIPTPYDHEREQLQHKLLTQQKKFLSKMRSGEDSFLTGKLYSDPFFR